MMFESGVNLMKEKYRKNYYICLGNPPAIVILAPFYWLVISSISSKADLLSTPINFFQKIYTENFKKIFTGGLNISGGEPAF